MNFNEISAPLRSMSYGKMNHDLLGRADTLLAKFGNTHGFTSTNAKGKDYAIWFALRWNISELCDIPVPAKSAKEILRARSRILTVLSLLKKLAHSSWRYKQFEWRHVR